MDLLPIVLMAGIGVVLGFIAQAASPPRMSDTFIHPPVLGVLGAMIGGFTTMIVFELPWTIALGGAFVGAFVVLLVYVLILIRRATQ